MIDVVAAAVKALLPGTLSFLLLGLSVGLALSRRTGRGAIIGRRMIGVLVAAYLLFSIPLGAMAVAAPLSWGFAQVQQVEHANGATAVVVLDGGVRRCQIGGHESDQLAEPSVLRAVEAARVASMLSDPLVVITAGSHQPRGAEREGSRLRDQLVREGIPASRIVVDRDSPDTFQHAVNVTRLLKSRGIERFVLVTSATHLRRATAAFRAAGADPVPSPAPVLCDTELRGWTKFWPSPTALMVSEAAVHDYVGLVYYWARGRL